MARVRDMDESDEGYADVINEFSDPGVPLPPPVGFTFRSPDKQENAPGPTP